MKDANEKRLYGVPGAEVLFDDPAEVYETDIEPYVDEHDRRPRLIEEHTVHPPSYHLPSVDLVIEHVVEWVGDDGMVVDFVFDRWRAAAGEPDVVAAFQAALDLLASKVGPCMADKLVATHQVTWDTAGEPLLDGEPMYVPATSGSVEQ